MDGIVGLASVLGWNYANHRRGRPTICSTFRRHVPPEAAVAGIAAGAYALTVHLLRGYVRDGRL